MELLLNSILNRSQSVKAVQESRVPISTIYYHLRKHRRLQRQINTGRPRSIDEISIAALLQAISNTNDLPEFLLKFLIQKEYVATQKRRYIQISR